MFPEEFENKLQAVGNSSLKGAAMLATEPQICEAAKEIAQRTEEISLSEDPFFQDSYVENMYLESSKIE